MVYCAISRDHQEQNEQLNADLFCEWEPVFVRRRTWDRANCRIYPGSPQLKGVG